VLLPVLLSTSVGIVALALGESSLDLILGVLVISFASAAIGSSIVVTVLLGRRAHLARLQADLLANVTHELRTPLAAIRMYAQTLQMGTVDEDPARARQCVDTIVRETEWLGTMIDRVLTWRAAARDRDNFDFADGPISEVAGEVAARFQRMLSPEEGDFQFDINTAFSVMHDKRAVASIMINLLTNAYKYTGEEKEIALRVFDEGGHVVISVQDNGIGIPRRQLRRIFDPFFRVDSRLRSKAVGAGLGLAIVNHMVRAHMGSVSVDSEEGRGATFVVKLPRSTEPEQSS